MTKLKESDLYKPVRQLLLSHGFAVKGEVNGCDVTALKGGDLWVVELKLHLNMTLLIQAMNRLSVTDFVFAAVPRPNRAGMKNFRAAQKIFEKLELGLITVSTGTDNPVAEIILFPGGKKANKNNKKSRAIKSEIEKRIGDTPGGVTKTKISTAYREKCIRVACVLEACGAKRSRDFKGDSKVLRADYYGWFKKNDEGSFELSEEGRAYLQENKESNVVIYYRLKANNDIIVENL